MPKNATHRRLERQKRVLDRLEKIPVNTLAWREKEYQIKILRHRLGLQDPKARLDDQKKSDSVPPPPAWINAGDRILQGVDAPIS